MKPTTQKVLWAVLLVVALLGLYTVHQGNNDLRHQISTMEGRISELQNTIYSLETSLTQEIEASLKQQESTVTHSDYEVLGLNKDKEVEVKVSVTPKTQHEQDTVEITYTTDTGESQSLLAKRGDDMAYTVTFAVPLDTYEVKYGVIITNGETKQVEHLGEIYGLREQFTLTAWPEPWSLCSSWEQGQCFLRGELRLTVDETTKQTPPLAVESAQVIVHHGDETTTLPLEQEVYEGEVVGQWDYYVNFDEQSVTCPAGESFELQMTMTDTLGIAYTWNMTVTTDPSEVTLESEEGTITVSTLKAR